MAFCFITIPSIDDVFLRLKLYLLSGQVAMANQALSQGEQRQTNQTNWNFMKYLPRFFQTVCVYSVLFSFLKVERGLRLHQHRCSKIFRLAILVLNNPKSWLFQHVVVVQKTAKKFTEESAMKPAKFFWAIKPLFFDAPDTVAVVVSQGPYFKAIRAIADSRLSFLGAYGF